MELDVQRALYQRDDSTCSSLEYEDMKRSSLHFGDVLTIVMAPRYTNKFIWNECVMEL